MSGPSGVMDWCSSLRLRQVLLTLFLLASANTGNPTTGGEHNLCCVNDYLFTINCTLSIAPSPNIADSSSSYWLSVIGPYGENTFVCMLAKTNEDYFCSFKTSDQLPAGDFPFPFSDLDSFEISLCHNQSKQPEPCELLDKKYMPVTSIKPNAPCCLTVSHNSSQHHFTWKSTYEEYKDFSTLIDNLKYQLHYYKRGDEHDVLSRDIYTDSMNHSVGDENLVPGTEYAARVRSSPNMIHFRGQWSDWSSEVYWKVEAAVNDLPPNKIFVSGLGKVFISLCVVVPLLLLLCYAPVKRWRQSSFIPTPAPYFHTLYSDCQGDFKSWVITQEKTADILKVEETLQINTLTKCADIQEEECQPQFHYGLMEGSTYSNITEHVTDPGCDTSLLGIPYAVSTMTPPSPRELSINCLSLSSQPESPTEGDSGCWLCSHTSLEREPPFYCNEYCTLSAFQQTSLVTAEHHRNPSTGMSRVDSVSEASADVCTY